MSYATAPAIQSPDEDRLELTEAGVAEKPIELRTARGGTADPYLHTLQRLGTALGDILAQLVELHLTALIR